jgi:hypothetical protein
MTRSRKLVDTEFEYPFEENETPTQYGYHLVGQRHSPRYGKSASSSPASRKIGVSAHQGRISEAGR